MKYIDADKLLAEFQKRFDICKRISEDDRNALDTQDWYRGKYTAYSECLSFITSHQQEKQPTPSKSVELEEEIKRYYREECSADDEPTVEEIARHFYEFGKKQKQAELIEEDEAAEYSHTISTLYDYFRRVLHRFGVYDEQEELLESREQWLCEFCSDCADAIFNRIRPLYGMKATATVGYYNQSGLSILTDPDAEEITPIMAEYVADVFSRKEHLDNISYGYCMEIADAFRRYAERAKQEQPEAKLDKFTEKIKTFQGRYKHPVSTSIKGAMAFMARMFYQYPNVARQWYEQLPKATMD